MEHGHPKIDKMLYTVFIGHKDDSDALIVVDLINQVESFAVPPSELLLVNDVFEEFCYYRNGIAAPIAVGDRVFAVWPEASVFV